MLKQDYGHIVAVSSFTGLAAMPLVTGYAASKYASVGMKVMIPFVSRSQTYMYEKPT